MDGLDPELLRAEVSLGLNSEHFEAEVDRAVTGFKARAAEIERTTARANFDINLAEFDRKLLEVRAQMKRLANERATMKINVDDEGLKRTLGQLDELKKKRNEIEAQKFDRQREISEANTLLTIQRTSHKEALDGLNNERKLREDARGILREQFREEQENYKLRDGVRRSTEQFEANRQAAADRIVKTEKAAIVERQRAQQLDEAFDRRRQANERQSIVDAARRLELEKQFREVRKDIKEKEGGHFDQLVQRASLKVDVDTEKAKLKLDLLRLEMEHKKIKIPVETDERSVRNTLRGIAAAAGGTAVGAAKGAFGFLGKGPDVLPGFGRVPLGAALAASPLLAAGVGGLTSLAGVTGAGAVGAASIAGGIGVGTIANLAGLARAFDVTSQETHQADQALISYEKTTRKFGEGSKQSIVALAEYKSILAEMTPLARTFSLTLKSGQEEWNKLTRASTEKNFISVIKDYGKAIKELAPGLAANTNRSGDIISRHAGTFFKDVVKEKGELDSLGKSANNFLDHALSAAENIGAVLLHVGAAAARIFSGKIGNDIQKWAEGLNNATQPGDKLNKTVTRLGNDAKDVFGFLYQLGKLFIDIFDRASYSGDKMAKSMTGAVKGWDEFVKSKQGAGDLNKYFRESEEAVGKLVPLLLKGAQLLGTWAAGLIPAANAVLSFLSGLTKLVEKAGKLIGLTSPLATLGTTLGALFIASKALAFASALGEVYKVMKAMAILNSAGGITSALGLLFAGEGRVAKAGSVIAERAGLRTAVAEGGAAVGGGALAEGASAIGAGTLLTGAATVAAGVGAGLVGQKIVGGLLGAPPPAQTHSVEEEAAKIKAWSANAKAAAQAAYELSAPLLQANEAFHQSRFAVDRSREALHNAKPGTLEYREALLQYRSAVNNARIAEEERNKVQHQTATAADVAVAKAREALGPLATQAKILREDVQAKPRNKEDAEIKEFDKKELIKVEAERAVKAKELAYYLDQQYLAFENIKRAQKDLAPITNPKQGEALGELAQKDGKLAQTIALHYVVPSDAGKVAQKSLEAVAKGVKASAVLDAVLHSKNAEDAIKKLDGDINEAVKNMKSSLTKGGHDAVTGFERTFGQGLPAAFGKAFDEARKVVETKLHGIGSILDKDLIKLGSLTNESAGAAFRGLPKLATGGLVQFGREGERGQDSIAANMMVAPGEVGAVFTAQQQQVANSLLAPVGGLPGLFQNYNKPHYFAKGGYVNPVPGLSLGRTDQGVDFSGAGPVYAIGNANFTRVSPQNSGTGWPGAAGRGTGAMLVYVLADGPDKGRAIYVAENIDPASGLHAGSHVRSGQQIAKARGFFPFLETGFSSASGTPISHDEYTEGKVTAGGRAFLALLQGLTGGKYTSGAFGSVPEIKAPHVGGTGYIHQLVQSALNAVTSRANSALKAIEAKGGGSGGGGTHSANEALGKSMMVKFGYPASEWPSLQALWTQESGWNANSVNKSSGAYGIPQALGHGHPFNLGDARAQIAWGLSYIKGRYGSPSAAEAHERAFNWYSQGGMFGAPALLVGEHENEYVINPKRADNAAYLKRAGEDMGYNVTPASKGKTVVKHASAVTRSEERALPDVAIAAPRRGIPASVVEGTLSKIEAALKAEKTQYHTVQKDRDKAVTKLKAEHTRGARLIREAEEGGKESVSNAHKAAARSKAAHAQAIASAGSGTPVEKAQKATTLQKAQQAAAAAERASSESIASAERKAQRRVSRAFASDKEKKTANEKKLRHLEEGLRKIKDGGTWEHTVYQKWTHLEAEEKEGRKAKALLKARETAIKVLNRDISGESHDLNILASQWAHTKDPATKHRLRETWQREINLRTGKEHDLRVFLEESKAAAVKFNAIHPSPVIKEFIESIDPETQSLEDSEQAAESEKENAPGESGGRPSLEGLLAESGKLPRLKEIEKNAALAATELIPDNPNTPVNEELPGLKKELPPAQALANFWRGTLGEVAKSGNSELITEVANSLTGANQAYYSLKDSIESSERNQKSQGLAEQNAFSVARLELYKQFGSNFAPVFQPVAPTLPAGGVTNVASAAAQPSKNVNVNVTNNFSHPPANPHHWSNGVAWELGAVI